MTLAPRDVGTTAPPRHTGTTMLLHWAAAAVLIVAFALGLLLDDWPRGVQRDTTMMVHYSLGSIVLALAAVRVMRRLLLPAAFPRDTGLTARAAALAHWGLYALTIALPLTGVLDR